MHGIHSGEGNPSYQIYPPLPTQQSSYIPASTPINHMIFPTFIFVVFLSSGFCLVLALVARVLLLLSCFCLEAIRVIFTLILFIRISFVYPPPPSNQWECPISTVATASQSETWLHSTWTTSRLLSLPAAWASILTAVKRIFLGRASLRFEKDR